MIYGSIIQDRSSPDRLVGSYSAKIEKLIENIDHVLDEILPQFSRVALLDFPDHDNIGDSAIYVGEIAYFKRKHIYPTYISSAHAINWTELDHVARNGKILLHGGGNFGDIWPYFHTFRLEILRRYRGQTIVQLPQTLHFSSSESLDETARAIAEHGAFTLLVRDQPSLKLATEKFDCAVALCPDMAFQIGKLPTLQPDHDAVLVLRTDKEAAAPYLIENDMLPLKILRADWPSEFRGFGMLAKLKSFGYDNLHDDGNLVKLDPRERYFRALAEQRVMRGVKLLSRGQTVITDRLHGHIISTLMGRRNIVIDNSYGKLSSFMSAWGTMSGSISIEASLSEAFAKIS
jgi:exopolysaccharide biosynthesis predicted pyruvyltransferase EpsI